MHDQSKILIVEDQFVEANHLRLMLNKAGYYISGTARSTEEAKQQMRTEKPHLVLLDIFLSGKESGIDLARYLRAENIAFLYLSANSNEEILNAAKATHPYGFLVKPFREKDLLIMMEIARYHHEHGLESSYRKEIFFQKQLKELSGKNGDGEGRLEKVTRALQPLIPYDFAVAAYKNQANDLENIIGFLRSGFSEYQKIAVNEFQHITNLKTHELQDRFESVIPGNSVSLYTGAEFEKVCATPGMKSAVAQSFHMRSNLVLPVPLPANHKSHFFFSFFSRQPFGFTEEHIAIGERLQQPLANIIEEILFHNKESEIIYKLKTYPIDVTASTTSTDKNNFSGIIGKSPSLLNVFDQITQVAPADTTVLITGESGSGKERIAESVHLLSPRKNQPIIKINCAALPVNLIESELFGHERGAFTGAIERRVGKFELANNGTLFLDEIGEMPLDMQAKLLRVLQEKEIERIGGKAPIKVNVRIITATNRNLEKEVAAGRFRLDLYYRINVFPIHVPPLRERREDIILLAQHFLLLYSSKNGKKIKHISEAALKSLLAYQWPGNIRELENLIERSVLLTNGAVIEYIPLPAMTAKPGTELENNEWYIKTIEENERAHILAVLNNCNGRIRGAGGAAQILGVPPTTLASKMKKLGIKRHFSES